MKNSNNNLKYNPLPFIFEKGNYYHVLKTLNFIEERHENRLREILEKARLSQNEDGGWSWLGRWDYDEAIPSSVTDTAYILPELIKADVDTQSDILRKAAIFLIDSQRGDGGWSENPELGKTMSESWTWFSVDHSVTWITGLAISALIRAGHPSNTPFIRKAIGFLKNMQNREGGWTSHTGSPEPGNTDMWTMQDVISAFLAYGEDRDSEIIKKAESAVMKHRNRWVEPIESPLGVFYMLGYDRGNQYVQECIRHLIENQKEDGGWGYYNSWRSSPDPTAQLLGILLNYGVRVG